MGIIALIAAIVFLILWLNEKKKHKKDAAEASERIGILSKYQNIIDAEAEARRVRYQAQQETEDQKAEAREILANAKRDYRNRIDQAERKAAELSREASERLRNSDAEAGRIIAEARAKAEEIAGNALDDKARAEEYRATAEAMKHVIEGYGDEWLKPTYSVLDDLADDFGYTEAGIELKKARLHSAEMVKDRRAATCDYVEAGRRDTAIAFVVDAFNGKVDSILSKVRHDNFGKLEQMIKDAFSLVNGNGRAFRNARITPAYLDSRLNELHWAVVVNEIKKRDQEQQRLIREQMREEERARREYEKAMKDAAKEEAMLTKAMEKAKAMLEKASAEQREKYEAQVAELEVRLKEAEEKNQRALSMAQQTRRGNVYVISNIGSFGENVYKVGMTRRLDPLDRVRELGDASVPFPFDVHAIIQSDDAPALETALHKDLAMMQVNKVNPRKEFFRISLAEIKSLVEARGVQASWTLTAEAAEYRESLAIEKQIKNDAGARAKWESFADSVANENAAE